MMALLFASVILSSPLFAMAFRMVSWNLRYDSQPNNITVEESVSALPDPLQGVDYLNITSEQPWSTRRLRVVELVLSEGVILAGTLNVLSIICIVITNSKYVLQAFRKLWLDKSTILPNSLVPIGAG